MAKTIFKYTLQITGLQTIAMPKNSEILCVQEQRNEGHLWAIVDENMPLEDRIFEIIGTGHPLEDNSDPELIRSYVGTFQVNGGQFVWHVFELFKV